MNCIFPVMNYHEQVINDLNMDILLLMAMNNIMRFANDYVEDQICSELFKVCIVCLISKNYKKYFQIFSFVVMY